MCVYRSGRDKELSVVMMVTDPLVVVLVLVSCSVVAFAELPLQPTVWLYTVCR